MNTFELDESALKKGWGADGQYWFSVNNYIIKDIVDFVDAERDGSLSETEFMLSLGYIPYFKVKRIELARAYIKSVGSEKLKKKMSSVSDKDYIEVFWKYYNAYPHLAEGYEAFSYNYLIGKAIDWCSENGINYVVK